MPKFHYLNEAGDAPHDFPTCAVQDADAIACFTLAEWWATRLKTLGQQPPAEPLLAAIHAGMWLLRERSAAAAEWERQMMSGLEPKDLN